MTQGGAVREFTLKIANFARKHLTDKRLRPWALELLKLTGQWNLLTVRIMLAARKDRDVVSSAAYDFLMYSGYVTMAYIWLRQAAVAVDDSTMRAKSHRAFTRPNSAPPNSISSACCPGPRATLPACSAPAKT